MWFGLDLGDLVYGFCGLDRMFLISDRVFVIWIGLLRSGIGLVVMLDRMSVIWFGVCEVG